MNNGSFVTVSDFHSNAWPLEKIQFYLNEYDVTYILGDATDRGNDKVSNVLNGKGGLKILLDIMDLSKKYPGRIIYIPGNHDEFLYDYAAHKNTQIGQDMLSSLYYNHGADTVKDIDNLEKTNPKRFHELINWLGSLPLQRTHTYKGQTYSLAHAFFNQNIYRKNPNFSLEDLYRSHNGIYNGNSPYSQIIWYRKKEGIYNMENPYNKEDVPADTTIIIGHTPIQYREGENLDLRNCKGGITKVICVDGGIAYQTAHDVMLKYEGGSRQPIGTLLGLHKEKNLRTKEITYTEDELNRLKKAAIATIQKYGAHQIEFVIIECIYKGRKDWFAPFTRPERFDIENIDIQKVKKMIESYSRPGENNPKVLANNFINAINIEMVKTEPVKIKKDNKEELISKSLEILNKIATEEEQSIIVVHKGERYTLRDYVIKVMPNFYIKGQLKIKSKGTLIDFTTFIENILIKNRKGQYDRRIKQLQTEKKALENAKKQVLNEIDNGNNSNHRKTR